MRYVPLTDSVTANSSDPLALDGKTLTVALSVKPAEMCKSEVKHQASLKGSLKESCLVAVRHQGSLTE